MSFFHRFFFFTDSLFSAVYLLLGFGSIDRAVDYSWSNVVKRRYRHWDRIVITAQKSVSLGVLADAVAMSVKIKDSTQWSHGSSLT